MDWQPVAAAIAAFIALQGPAVANLLVTIANRRKLDMVHQNTNGTLQALTDKVAALESANAALRDKVERLLQPPGAV